MDAAPSTASIAAALGLRSSPSASTALAGNGTVAGATPSKRGRARRAPPIVDKEVGHYLMSAEEIAAEGGPSVATQRCWKCSGRYGWDQIVLKIGHSSRVRRSDWQNWLASRTASVVDAETSK